jgi:hypothetical protein
MTILPVERWRRPPGIPARGRHEDLDALLSMRTSVRSALVETLTLTPNGRRTSSWSLAEREDLGAQQLGGLVEPALLLLGVL